MTIDGGTLQTVAGGLGTTGTINFGGGILQYAAATTTDFSSRISSANNQAFNIDTNGNNVTFATSVELRSTATRSPSSATACCS